MGGSNNICASGAVAEQWISQEEWVASDGRLAKYRLILNPSTFKACIVLIYPLALFSDCCCYKEWKNNLVWCKQLHSNLPCWAACAFSALISVAVHLRWWEALDADWRSHGWRKWRWPGHRGKCAIKNQVKSCKMIEGNLSLMRLGYLIQFWFAMPVYQLKAEFFFLLVHRFEIITWTCFGCFFDSLQNVRISGEDFYSLHANENSGIL